MVHLHAFAIQREINPVHALSILCTTFVAVFVAVLIDRNRSKDKSEKELFLKRVDAISAIADCLHEKISEQRIPLSEATSRLKRITSSVRCVYKTFNAANSRMVTIPDSDVYSILRELNVLMTFTQPVAIAGRVDAPITISKGVCTYSVSRGAEIESQVEALKNILFRIQIDINDCYPLS
jgi:hypothetical protein